MLNDTPTPPANASGVQPSRSLGEPTREEQDLVDAQWDNIPAAGPAPSSSPDLLPEGSRFGGYVVGPCIGEGGMARIYRAEHEALQRQVALKVLLKGLDKDREGHDRFLREARMAAAIKHPNVVNIFDIGVHAGAPYLVMELLDGVDLDSFVQSRGPLDEATMMDVIMPIVSGLAAVHDAGIVHRDLKPGNIFLAHGRGDELEPKLLDFGISKSISPNAMKVTSARGLMMGTPFYMSPEAGRGLEVTPLSDQYSLGVVLYECATGVNPFIAADTLADVVRRVTTGDYQPVSKLNPGLSKRMVSIIERAMHVEPERRFPDMRAMGRELLFLAGRRTRITWGLSFGELAGTAPSGAPLLLARSAPPPPKSTTSRRRTTAYAIAAGFLATAAWIGVEAFRGTGASSPLQQAFVQTQGSVAALHPTPGPAVAHQLPGPFVADVADAPPATETAPATERAPALDSEPLAAVEPQSPPSGERPRRAARDRSRSERARAPAAPKPARQSSAGAEWLVSSQEPAQQDGTEELGTNNAPIFD
jgi:tRNA A-37 threonylcarbamoyl transferase component Bud32